MFQAKKSQNIEKKTDSLASTKFFFIFIYSSKHNSFYPSIFLQVSKHYKKMVGNHGHGQHITES